MQSASSTQGWCEGLGYPAPTPPGAIELKAYPGVRRAEYSGTMAADIGMNIAFFPQFNRIKRRNIAMTSPVEVDIRKSREEGAMALGGWTRSFLYREPGMGVTGEYGSVKIVDVATMTVLSIGVRGATRLSQMRQYTGELRAWLATSTEREAAAEPRALFYNGPDVPARARWGEL